jgi:hypothetical protein
MYSNNASFSAEFSTILRASRAADISEEIRDGDASGKDPQPKYFAKATVAFASPLKGQTSSKHGTVEVLSENVAVEQDPLVETRSGPGKLGFYSRVGRTASS